MRKSALSLILVTLLCLASCKKNVIDPPIPPDDSQPGRRDYVWSVDTLRVLPSFDPFTPVRIWGSAPNDVWIVGSAGSMANAVWHYDGTQWSRNLQQRINRPWAIYGFGPSNVWIGTLSGSFWKYDGVNWFKFNDFTFPGSTYNWITNIYGVAPNDVYAVGSVGAQQTYSGIVMHFNGSKWENVALPILKVGFNDLGIQNSTGHLFLEGATDEEGQLTVWRLYVYDGKNLNEVYSGYDLASVSMMNGEVYSALQHKLYKFKNDSLVLWKDLANTTFLGKVWGRSERDFFSYAADGIGHYNGEDFKTIYQIDSDRRISIGIVLGNEVFFPCYSVTNNISVVIHGKLP